ncbi:Pentatricopeptide repeat [Dillenia turbinata]|uniref:Pentatricopeptide repeat n=1 Tax=Dillenia turbinata TaxID=194707 RepID=A0AAN8VLH7_9MAGN
MVHAQIVILGYALDTFVSTSILNTYAKLGMIKDSCQVKPVKLKKLRNVSDLGLESCVSVGAALIDMYSKWGLLCIAISIFSEMFSKCSANLPWNAMLSGYSQHGRSDEALELYILMQVQGMVFKYGYGSAVMDLKNAIADAYSKCLSLEDVRKIFDRMNERSSVLKHTSVCLLSMCVLVACANLCLIESGQQVHGLLCRTGMAFDRHVESSLIDIYSKCGSIDEADKVFKRVVYKFYTGDGKHQLKGEMHSKLDELSEKVEAMGYQPDLRCAFQIDE